MPGENSLLLELRSPTNADYRNRTFVRDAVLELSYPPPTREPDLSLPLPDLPDGNSAADEPLPPVEPPLPEPTEALSDFWSQSGGSL